MLRAVLAAVLLLLCVTVAAAEEVITRFVSTVTVERDGVIEVTEKISVRAEGNKIKRGITRDFPTRYKDSNGRDVSVGFSVDSVSRDGVPENYRLEDISNGERIRIGNKDVFLDPGSYTYTIKYRTSRQLGFFDDHDELYWNATGNEWDFPIEFAEYHLRLPEDAVISRDEFYTGRVGERGRDAKATRAAANQLKTITTRRLDRREGLTVVAAWQKGIIAPPAGDTGSFGGTGAAEAGLPAAAAVLLAAFGYFLFAWFRVGRDPPKGTVFPQFHPPEGMSPAGVRYAWHQEDYDNTAFAAGIVGLAVKGRMKIEDKDGGFAITRLKNSKGPQLTRSEQALYDAAPGTRLELDNDNHEEFGRMQRVLGSALKDEFADAMFFQNFWWFLVGALLSILGVIIIAVFMPTADQGLFLLFPMFFLAIWWTFILAGARMAIKGFSRGRGVARKIGPIFAFLFLVPFVVGGIMVPAAMLSNFGSPSKIGFMYAGALLLLAMNFVFYWLLKAPTPYGRKVLDHVEGFRMYLMTAEEDRLNKLNPPEKTPELFERYLPFAMALDCENEWNAKFAAVLAAAAAAGTAASTPVWYSGNHWGSRSFANNFSSGFSSATASASTAPGSSSGFSGGGGGGGSSGGGGGGGGGGGW